jgi:glycosyltransferase involved in cell wall biosynthesis
MNRPVYILDPGAFTPAYCGSLVRAMRERREEAWLLTSDSIIDPREEAGRIPGRRYFFQRISKRLRRGCRAGSLGERAARWLGLGEYAADLVRLFGVCVMRRPLLHVHWMPAWPLDVAFLVCARAIGTRIVYTVHNPLPHDTHSRFIRGGLTRAYRTAHHLIFHSDIALRDFEAAFPKVATPRSIVPIGVLFDDCAPIAKPEARAQFDWRAEEIVIVFIGHIKRYKGLDLLLEAMARAETARRMRLVLGVVWRADRDANYDALVERVRAKHAVEILDRIPERDETVALMSGADLMALPYREASASAPGMIAMRFGLPIIAANTGSFPGMLGDALAEWLVPAEDAEALAHALERFCALPDGERAAFSDAIRMRGETEFSWRSIAERTLSVYARVERGD